MLFGWGHLIKQDKSQEVCESTPGTHWVRNGIHRYQFLLVSMNHFRLQHFVEPKSITTGSPYWLGQRWDFQHVSIRVIWSSFARNGIINSPNEMLLNISTTQAVGFISVRFVPAKHTWLFYTGNPFRPDWLMIVFDSNHLGHVDSGYSRTLTLAGNHNTRHWGGSVAPCNSFMDWDWPDICAMEYWLICPSWSCW